MSTDYVSLDPSDHYLLEPFSSENPLAAKLFLTCSGEYIQAARIQSGLLHKGIEKVAESKTWYQNIFLSERVDSYSSAFYQLAFCQSVERLSGIQIPKRAQRMRLILCELLRIAEHFRHLSEIAKALEHFTARHYFLRERETILDLLELLTGTRFNHSYFRFGGIHQDVTEGFIERVSDLCRNTLDRLEEHKKVFLNNPTIKSRTGKFAVIGYDEARAEALTGPCGRAAGLSYDVRERFPYLEYALFEVRTVMGRGLLGARGDAYDRIHVRFDEIYGSLYLLSQATQRIPSGETLAFRADNSFSPPEGFAYSRVEGPRGEIICAVFSDGGVMPARVAWKTPSQNLVRVFERAAVGTSVFRLSELAVSLDISFQEVDL